MAGPSIPELDDELRRRLSRRFGSAIDAWFDNELPLVLNELAGRWGIEWDTVIQRGSMSVVIRCRTTDGRPAVLKASPERERIAHESVALACWKTSHVPAVLATDESVGALLIEAIEPGTALDEATAYPSMESLIDLMTSLHANGVPDSSYRPVASHIAYLFDSGMKNYERRPELAEVVSHELYERGRQLAMRLAEDDSSAVLLHGDLTPVNVLDGGEDRGLVAIDPAPCLGDPAFDAIDLVFWRAEDVETIAARAEALAPAIGADGNRLLNWCAAFAGMVALEMAEAPDSRSKRIDTLVALASSV
jgi:streptomycin 6-kinase